MNQLIVLACLIACAYGAPGHIAVAPAITVAHAPTLAVAHSVPIATSYQNTYRAPVVKAAPLTIHTPVVAPIVKTHHVVAAAPAHHVVAHHAPVIAAPAVVAHHAPIVAAPVVHTAVPLTSYAHTYGHKTVVAAAPIIKTGHVLVH